MLLMLLMGRKLLERFKKMNCKRQINKNLRYKKWLKEKEANYMSNGKVMIMHWMGGLIKTMLY